MTEIQLKSILKEFDTIQKKVKIQENCLNIYKNAKTMSDYKKNKLIVKIISNVIDILNPSEAFVINTHLITHYTWTETTELYSRKFGKNQEKSERTLKRVQNKGISKMLEIINTLEVNDIFH